MSIVTNDQDGHWSAAEDAALHELPYTAQLIYLRGLRRRVDARTGVVGLTHPVSRRTLSELLTIAPCSGRKGIVPTQEVVIHALETLISVGLIARVSGYERRLVFRLPIALQDKSAFRMNPRMSPRSSARMSPRRKAMSGAAIEPISDRMNPRSRASFHDLHQTKEIPLGNTTSVCISTQRARASRIDALCDRLKREAGMLDVSPRRLDLIRALDDGIEIDHIVKTAQELIQQRGHTNLGYLLATIRGRIQDATASRESGNAVRGQHRLSVCDRIEEQDREATARERRERMRIVE